MSAPIASNDGRVDLATVSLATLANQVYAEYDYTNPAIGDQYYQNLLVLFNAYNQGVTYDPGSTDPNPIPGDRLTQQDADNIAQALKNLTDLAQNGQVLNNTPTSVKKYFLTQQMVSNLDLIIRSFQAVGAADPTQGITLTQLNAWKDLSVNSPVIQSALTIALQQKDANTSLQALLELSYVKTGSDLINEKLTNLNDALTLTKGVLETLGSLQSVHNQVQVIARGSIPFDYVGPYASAGDFRGGYTGAASAYFGKPLTPVVPSTLLTYNSIPPPSPNAGKPDYSSPTGLTAAGLSTFNKLMAYRQSILSEIAKVSAQSSPEELTSDQSLYAKLKNIKADLSTLFTIPNPSDPTGPPMQANSTFTGLQKASALSKWILDNYNSADGSTSANAGLAQQNLTLAITAAQSLNDTQKTNVRNFLYVFQQYYQSAAAMLTAINQMIQKMAQGISQ